VRRSPSPIPDPEATKPLVVLDRDGVLNVDRPGFVTSLAELEMIPGAAQGVAELRRAGYRVVVASNQSCVGRGLVERSVVDAVNAAIDAELGDGVDAWYVCPHGPDDGCGCRKPSTGLLAAARSDWHFRPELTWAVGDDVRDVEAARRFGCRPALVRTGKGRAAAAALPGVPVFDDLLAFARWLTERPARGS